MNLSYEDIKQIYQTFNSELEKNHTKDELFKQYLGKKGVLKDLLKNIGQKNATERSQYGKEVNTLKTYIEETLDQLNDTKDLEYAHDTIDFSAPFDINTPVDKRPAYLNKAGSQHPTTRELEYILEIFAKMGFDVEESRQLDDDYHMFQSLNFPIGHPARDNWDTFWTEESLIPPAHTSTMQNRVLRKYANPPIRVVIPGRCFRNEATDASHEHTLHQIEGVYVDKNISMGDMLGTIKTYLEAFFQTDLKVKVQPAYFPFTEPDSEFVISCPFCQEAGCNVCGYGGWIEIMGCGMIHPNVLTEAGIDPTQYSGFAWGFGLDRLVMIKNGIKDIRKLHSGDLEILEQL